MNDGKKRKPQKYQNKAAFKIMFDPMSTEHQKKVSLTLLCKRCADQIQWKLQYNKYKKIAEPGKCNFCHNKIVVRTYMKACDPCSLQKKVCPKCLQEDFQLPEDVKLSAKEVQKKSKQTQKLMNDYIQSLRLRSKKKIARQLQKGIIEWDVEMNYFADKEGKQITGLHFKTKGFEDIMDEEDIMDDNDDQEEDEF